MHAANDRYIVYDRKPHDADYTSRTPCRLPQRGDHQPYRQRQLLSAGVIGVVTGKGVKSVLQHPNKLARFKSGEGLAQTLERYVWLYNQHLPQLALQHLTPIQAMKSWRKRRPDLFKKRICNRPGLDT
ncbi:hypothetical protein THUN1379_03160 [Paludibacterium sp. THUN1379]|nr:hypothetical protein THUN1379_03160 [Paludibacterium sp. THUN1379]